MNQGLSFIVAGAQKCGTTALFSYLSDHDAFQAPFRKELHVFDDESRDWSSPDFSGLNAAFPPFDGRPRYEATPITLYWPAALDRAKRYNPAIKLLLIFRDPVVRAFSHWRMECARGHESEPFGWCIREGRRRVGAAHRVFSYVERGEYGAQLARALAIFDSGQILCLANRELYQNPAATLSKVCAFLGVDAPGHLTPRIVRPPQSGPQGFAVRPSVEDETYLRRLYSDDLASFYALSGLSALDLKEGWDDVAQDWQTFAT